jgi:hypothetical protein
MVLQVEESGGSLDVGEGFGASHFLPLEHLARAERPFELAHELFKVMLHNTVQRDQVAVDVIQDFNGRGLGPHEIQRGTAGKDFDIAFVWWKSGMRRSARRRLPPIQGMMGVDIESKTFTVWINRC